MQMGAGKGGGLWLGCEWFLLGDLNRRNQVSIFYHFNFFYNSSMNCSKSIFKSNKVIGLDSEQKKVKVQILSSNGKIQECEENKENFESLDKPLARCLSNEQEAKPVLLLKTCSVPDGSCKVIRAKSCLKRTNTIDDDEAKSTKSIKFKEKTDKVFEYHLPPLAKKNPSHKRLAPLKDLGLKEAAELKLECCEIY